MKTHVNTFQYWKCIKEVLCATFSDKRLLLHLIFSLVILGAGIAASIFVPFLFKMVIDSFTTPVETPFTMILISYGVLWMLSQASTELRAFLNYKIEQRITRVLGTKVLTHLYNLSHRYFIEQKPGVITNIIRRAQRDVPSLVLGILFHVIPTILEFTFVIILVARLYPPIFSTFLGGTFLCFFAYTIAVTKMVTKERQSANTVDQNVDGFVTDWLSNHEAIKTFGQKNSTIAACKSKLKEREAAEVKFLTRFSLSRLGQSFILGVSLTSFTYLVGMAVVQGTISVGDFVLLNGYLLQFIMPVSLLGHVIQDIKRAIVDMKDVLVLLLTKSDVQEISRPLELTKKNIQIEFKNVSFCYSKKNILNNLNCKITPGKTVFIVGSTGVGKSTLAKLLLRLYDPTQGRILFNDIDLKHLSFQSLYENIGWVPQETYLLNDSIRNNIQFVRPEASQEDIETALKRADIFEFVMNLPDKLDTCVGDKGLKLSGGQKQRLSLARLFLKEPSICIFDEATSALDRETELRIQKNINKYLGDTTKIIITHRPFAIDGRSQIINLDKNSYIKVENKNSPNNRPPPKNNHKQKLPKIENI